MKKTSLLLLSALLGVATWSCSDDDDAPAVVGITTLSVTPQGSAVSYTADIDQVTGEITTTTAPIAWDVTDGQLENATIKATTTIGATAYYNNTAIPEDGLTVNVTSPITIEARDAAGTTRSYTLTVTRATEADGQSLVLKSSSFQGFPANVISYSMAMFKGEFYANVVTYDADSDLEQYLIYKSEDGVNWSNVDYKCAGSEEFVVGGEGSSMVELNGRLYVIGGARSKGADKFGNPADAALGWFGPDPVASLSYFLLYSTADGVTFTDEAATAKYFRANGNEAPISYLASAYMLPAVHNNKLYIRGTYTSSFSMLQSKMQYVMTDDGKNFYEVDYTPAEYYVKSSQNNAFYSFKGKLWIVGGYRSFISESMMLGSIYSSADGTNWEENTLPEALQGLCFCSAMATDEAAIIVGGEFVTTDGTTMNAKMFRSTDGINWEQIDVVPNYVARRSPSIVMAGNVGWIFGGFKELAVGNYGWPDGTGAELLTDTWVKLIN